MRGWWSLEHFGDVPAAAWASGAAEGETVPEPRKPQLFQLGRPFLRESSPSVALHSWWCPSSHFHGISPVPAGDALSRLSRDLAGQRYRGTAVSHRGTDAGKQTSVWK